MSRRGSILFISILILVAAAASFLVGIVGSELSSVYASMGLSALAALLLVFVATLPRATASNRS